MKPLKLWEPKFVENSNLPVWLSKFSPIDIWAISLAFWVHCRGELSKTTKRHELVNYITTPNAALHFPAKIRHHLNIFHWNAPETVPIYITPRGENICSEMAGGRHANRGKTGNARAGGRFAGREGRRGYERGGEF